MLPQAVFTSVPTTTTMTLVSRLRRKPPDITRQEVGLGLLLIPLLPAKWLGCFRSQFLENTQLAISPLLDQLIYFDGRVSLCNQSLEQLQIIAL